MEESEKREESERVKEDSNDKDSNDKQLRKHTDGAADTSSKTSGASKASESMVPKFPHLSSESRVHWASSDPRSSNPRGDASFNDITADYRYSLVNMINSAGQTIQV